MQKTVCCLDEFVDISRLIDRQTFDISSAVALRSSTTLFDTAVLSSAVFEVEQAMYAPSRRRLRLLLRGVATVIIEADDIDEDCQIVEYPAGSCRFEIQLDHLECADAVVGDFQGCVDANEIQIDYWTLQHDLQLAEIFREANLLRQLACYPLLAQQLKTCRCLKQLLKVLRDATTTCTQTLFGSDGTS